MKRVSSDDDVCPASVATCVCTFNIANVHLNDNSTLINHLVLLCVCKTDRRNSVQSTEQKKVKEKLSAMMR